MVSHLEEIIIYDPSYKHHGSYHGVEGEGGRGVDVVILLALGWVHTVPPRPADLNPL